MQEGTAEASVAPALCRELTTHLSAVERRVVVRLEFSVCVLALVSVFALFRVGELLASAVVDIFAGNGAVGVDLWVPTAVILVVVTGARLQFASHRRAFVDFIGRNIQRF